MIQSTTTILSKEEGADDNDQEEKFDKENDFYSGSREHHCLSFVVIAC